MLMKKFTLIFVALLLMGVAHVAAAVGDVIKGEAVVLDTRTLKKSKVEMAFQVVSMPRIGKTTVPGTCVTYGTKELLRVVNCVEASAPGYIITVPDAVDDYKVIGVGEYSFAGLTFTGVVLPATTTGIGKYAFDGFDGGIGAANSLVLPAKCRTVEQGAFRNYKTAVESIDLPEGLTTIGNSAFMGANMQSVTIPKTVTSIGTGVFANCKSLTSLTVAEENAKYYTPEGTNVIMRTEDDALVQACASTTAIPDNATSIGASAFYGMPIESVTIPAAVTEIGSSAFRGSALKTLELPATVATLGTYAFYGCASLEKVDIKSCAIEMGANAFANCSTLGEVYVRGTETMPTLAGSDNEFSGIKEGATLYVAQDKLDDYKAEGSSWVTMFGTDNIKAYTEEPVVTYKVGDIITATISIKTLLGKQLVDGFAEMAFEITALPKKSGPGQCVTVGQLVGKRIVPCTNAKAGSVVTVPEQVSKTDFYVFDVVGIGSYSFNNLEFRQLILPTSIKAIQKLSFAGFKGAINSTMGDLVLPEGLVMLDERAFDGYASAVNSIVLPNTLTTIGAGAFSGVNVKTINLPSSVKTLGAGFASSCTSLTTLTVDDHCLNYYTPEGYNVVMTNATHTLVQASANTTVVPDNTQSIATKAFYGMPMEEIDIPASVILINSAAFGNCSNLQRVILRSTEVPTLSSNSNEFSGIAEDATLYVLEALLEEYQAEPWTTWFANIEAIPEGGVPEPIHEAACEIGEPEPWAAMPEYLLSPTGEELDNSIFAETIPQWFPHQPTFVAGKAYTVRMHVKCVAPKYFADDFTATVNGKEANIINRKTDDDGYCRECAISYTWHIADNKMNGDTNGDGKVNTADVVAIYSFIEKGESSGFTREDANVNGDENVNTADVVAVYDRIVNGTSSVYSLDGVDFKMIPVAGGTFMMGSSDEDVSARDDEKPQHEVTLDDYAIGETEVTQALWMAVMDENPSKTSIGDNKPVEVVTWYDAQKFIAKLNEIFADQLDGKVFRLPTEAEWEFAARGGNKSQGYLYSGSDDVSEVAWLYANSDSQLGDVATLKPNELGLYDMSGNVWEWCSDRYGAYTEEAATNPTGPATGDYRVSRGAAFNNADDSYARVTSRDWVEPDIRYTGTGLRLVIGAPIE